MMLDTAPPTARMTAFLGKFEAALAAADIDAAVAMFAADSYWRDLVASPGTSRPWKAAIRSATSSSIASAK
jgi:putative flavoprotein involved in K+ transport